MRRQGGPPIKRDTTNSRGGPPSRRDTANSRSGPQDTEEPTLDNLQREVAELQQKVIADRITINFLQERNKELWNRNTPRPLPIQPNCQITLSSKEWYTINGVLNQALKYLTELFEEAESSKLHLPHAAKDYRTILKEFEDTQKLLQEHSDAQPRPPSALKLGIATSNSTRRGLIFSSTSKTFYRIPLDQGIVKVTNARMKFDKTGLGADTRCSAILRKTHFLL